MNAPLLVMPCSADKKATSKAIPILELYDGPLWQQVRKANYPSHLVAVMSAEHGLLDPEVEIPSYDRKMDEARLLELVCDNETIDNLAIMIESAGFAVIVGGELYKLLSLALLARYPELIDKVRFVCGSYLQQ